MAKIIDGKAAADRLRADIKSEVEQLKATGLTPGLAVVLVGDDPASQVYVSNKEKACANAGIYSKTYRLPAETSQWEMISLVGKLNADRDIHGILVQMPLPAHIDESAVIEAISPAKDVDAFHPVNVGKIMIGEYDFLPCTPAGIVHLIKETGVPIQGSDCVVVGRSNIVGKPMAMLLLHENATVTICHSRTKNLAEKTRSADILVSAVGKAGFITADMIKPGAVVIDVGMNRDAQGKLCGDVDFGAAEKVAGHITPVPGGVGPMTITMLLENTLKAAKILDKVRRL